MKSQKKPRSDSIIATTIAGTDRIGISVAPGGKIIFENEVTNVVCERTCEREGKGEKVISRVPQDKQERYTFEAEEAIDEFKHIFAVDTNTKNIGGCMVSIVGFLSIQKAFSIDCNGFARRLFQFVDYHCAEFHNVTAPAENHGWLYAISYIQNELGVNESIGIIVDSDLGALPQYNCRAKPFYMWHYLPHGVKLIYASSDKDRRRMVNAALHHADRASAACLERLENGSTLQDGRQWIWP